jgi:NAD(P)H-dependent FMN reductase
MSKANVLIVYYSRSGVTARVAKALTAQLDADVEEIVERSDRSGALGFVRSIIDVLSERPAKISAVKHDPSSYELVVIATPVWAHRVAAPVHTWVTAYRASLHRIAFLCTLGGSGAESALGQMTRICGRPLAAQCTINSHDIKSGAEPRLLDLFAERLARRLAQAEALEWTC